MKRRGAVVGCTLALLAGACGGVGNLSIPTPPSTEQGPATTVVADLSQTSEIPVPSQPPRTITIGPGKASLSGTVTGPSGPAPGATVLIERLVGDAVASKAITVRPDGTWKLGGILGGRYRVRAWLAPTLALTTPQILYLSNADSQNLALPLALFNGTTASATVVPSPPTVGAVATVVVQVSAQTVGPDGVVRAAPVAGDMVDLLGSPIVTIGGINPGTTDGTGRAVFQIQCNSTGPTTLLATINTTDTFPLNIADCGAFVTPPPTLAPTTTTTTTPFRTSPPST